MNKALPKIKPGNVHVLVVVGPVHQTVTFQEKKCVVGSVKYMRICGAVVSMPD